MKMGCQVIDLGAERPISPVFFSFFFLSRCVHKYETVCDTAFVNQQGKPELHRFFSEVGVEENSSIMFAFQIQKFFKSLRGVLVL